MTEMDPFLKLAAAARRESVPTIDVSERVLTSLRDPAVAARVASSSDPAYYLFALVAVSSAAVVLLFAWQSFESLREPLTPLVEPLYLVIR
ncbi:hypothetical protein Psta_1968 [Pirellula staleyi DSM 6068]|uniref:Uncharacterized protein n=1 Tax=Pirellula staleyi (strain ATCC 27377 / DSM 6068 / ICPB 4128) TaxID=530564 RepID=D2R0P4_PIRSD|nr:hypothetical protein [Pirellula staleyi]ADB16642.1 hypothetical protein Psta_1968 [Pirellula staleyi DSM 6068]